MKCVFVDVSSDPCQSQWNEHDWETGTLRGPVVLFSGVVLCMCVCVFVCLRTRVCMNVCVCLCLIVPISVCVGMYLCVCVCVCVSMCVYERVCEIGRAHV